jgi:UDP-N-acetylmuramyl pentapeptide phosphotransferase/UDP-N-acetylglucosamine-1-phosphate transferase
MVLVLVFVQCLCAKMLVVAIVKSVKLGTWIKSLLVFGFGHLDDLLNLSVASKYVGHKFKLISPISPHVFHFWAYQWNLKCSFRPAREV